MFKDVDIVFIISYGLVFLFGTLGNCLVMNWFGAKSERKKAANILLITLTINGLCSSILIPMLYIYFIIIVSLVAQSASHML